MRQVNLKFDKSKTHNWLTGLTTNRTTSIFNFSFNAYPVPIYIYVCFIYPHWRRQIHEIANDLIKWSFILSMLPHPNDLMMCEYKGWTVNVNTYIETEIATEMDWLYDNVPYRICWNFCVYNQEEWCTLSAYAAHIWRS